MNKKLCVYTICKNEIAFIKRWFNNVKDADYICILDTGSTDGTWEYIQNLPVIKKQLIFTQWSFGKARSEAYKLIPADTNICVHLDVDEYLSDNWVAILKNNWDDQTVRVGYIREDSSFSSKYLAHKYFPNLYWDYDVFEEPCYEDEKGIHYLWNYVLEETCYLENIILTHSKDTSKNRDYSFLAENKINRCVMQSINYGSPYQKLSCLHSSLEAFIYLNSKREILESKGANFSYLINLLDSLKFDFTDKKYLFEYQKYFCLMSFSKLFSNTLKAREASYFLIYDIFPHLIQNYGFTDPIKTLIQIGLCDASFVFLDNSDFFIIKELINFIQRLGKISTLEELLLLRRVLDTISLIKNKLNLQKPVLKKLENSLCTAEEEFKRVGNFSSFSV